MHDDILVPVEDTDAIHTLPLSVIPLKSRALRRARLVKNARLESMVELFSSKETGSGQVTVPGLARAFDFSGDKANDLVIVGKLRRLGIDVDDVDHLKLSPGKTAELSTYMRAFTRPLLVAIYGTRNDQRLDFRQIVKLFSDPDESAARRRLLDIVGRLNIELAALPSFLEQYGDVYLSLAYYEHCLDQAGLVLENLYGTLHQIQGSSRFVVDEPSRKSCEFVDNKLREIAEEVTHILELFKKRTADMWQDISAAKFRDNRQLVYDYQTKIGAALCALTVKADAWARTFPDGNTSNIRQRADFVRDELRAGLENVGEIKPFEPHTRAA